MKVCLTCAPGGHLVECLKLINAFKQDDDIFLVTYNENFEVSAHQIKRIYFIKNLVIKKVNSPKIIKSFYLVISMVYLFIKEFIILIKEKPDIILSTGSEIVLPCFFIAKFFGIKTIFVESLTRIDDLSGTGKISRHLTNLFLVQWPELSKKYKKAIYKGNLLQVHEKSEEKRSEGFIFVTVGTASFNRLVRMADNLAKVVNDKVIIQRGRTNYKPQNAEYFDFTKDLEEFDSLISKAKVVISHAGVGTILNVLDKKAPLIVVPRRKKNKEHIDDHQVELASYLKRYSTVEVANDEKDLLRCIKQINDKSNHNSVLKFNTNKNDLIQYLTEQLDMFN